MMRFLNRRAAFTFRRFYSEVKINQNAAISAESEISEIKEIIPPKDEKSNSKATPKEWRINAQIMAKENIHRWISEQTTFPKGKEQDFSIFYRFEGNPIRYAIPGLSPKIRNIQFKQLTDNDKKIIINHMIEVCRHPYIKQEKKVYAAATSIYERYRSIPEIKQEYFRFQVKKNNGEKISSMLRLQKNLVDDPVIFTTQLQTIKRFKNSKHSLADIRKMTRMLADKKIPISNELVYLLYYLLPKDVSLFMLKELKDKMEVYQVLYDTSYSKIETFDEIKALLSTREIDLTYASYIQMVRLMCKEYRIYEGLYLLNFLINKLRVEIPLSLATYMVDMIASHSLHLAIPAALFIQRITGCSLKHYAMFKVEKYIAASKVLDENTFDLLNMLLSSSKWKTKEIREEVAFNIKNSPKEEELIKLLDPKNKSPEKLEEYEELSTLFLQRYCANDAAFRPGYDFQEYDEIFSKFPNMKKFGYIKKDIMNGIYGEDNKDFNLTDYYLANISPLSKQKKEVFVNSCDLIVQIFLEQKQYHKIVPFVEYVKKVNGMDISFNSYLKTVLVIGSRPELQNVPIEDNTLLNLAVLLAHHIYLRPKQMIKETLKQYPKLDEILFEVCSSKSQFYDKAFKEYIEEVSWITTSPPDLSLQKVAGVSEADTKKEESNDADGSIKEMLSSHLTN